MSTLVKEETQSAFSKGLEDIVAAESGICSIDGRNSKLRYRGYEIHDLVQNSNFEETAYLLIHGDLPTSAQLADFKAKLAKERGIPAEVIKFIQGLPKKAHPMAALRSGLSVLSHFDAEADDLSMESNLRKAIRLIARTPTIVGVFERSRQGKDPIAPKLDPAFSAAANFLYMLSGKDASALEVTMLDKYFIMLAEHDLNASTFAARVTVSTLSDIYSAVVSAVGALKGDLHGSANSRAMESLLAIGDAGKVDAYVDDALRNKKKLMGFGHRVYKGADPRAADLKEMARALAKTNADQAKWYAISEKLEKAVWDRKQLYPNVDFYSASILYTLGIPIDLFTTVFATGRMAGWTAHALEQLADNRLMRPLSHYVGPENRAYVSIDHRK